MHTRQCCKAATLVLVAAACQGPGTTAAPPDAAAPTTTVRGNVKGVDFDLPYAYATLEAGNESIRILLSSQPVAHAPPTCAAAGGDARAERLIHFSLPSGPRADFFRGGPITVSPTTKLPRGWSVGQKNTEVTITRLDLGALVIEGEVLIVNDGTRQVAFRGTTPANLEQGALEGSFRARICVPAGMVAAVLPSLPAFVPTPLVFTVAGRRYTVGSAYSNHTQVNKIGPALQITLSAGPALGDFGGVSDGDFGLRLDVIPGPDGRIPLDTPTTVAGRWVQIPSGLDAKADELVPIGILDAAVVINDDGRAGHPGVVRGHLSLDMRAEAPAATDGRPKVVVPITGSGTFEVPLSPPDHVD